MQSENALIPNIVVRKYDIARKGTGFRIRVREVVPPAHTALSLFHID